MTPQRSPEQIVLDITVRLGLLVLFLLVTFTLVRPFLPIAIWSVILAVALFPVFTWLRARLGGRGWLAAGLLTAMNLIVVFGPAALLISSLVVSLEHLAAGIQDGSFRLPPAPDALLKLPVVGKGLHDSWVLAASNFPGFFQQYGHAVVVPGERVLLVVAGLAGSVLVFAVSVLVTGLLFVPGPRAVAWVRAAAAHVVGEQGANLVGLAGATIRNVARGVIGLSVLQTLIIGVGLIVADVPHAGLLTLAVLVLAVAQIGPGPIVLPLVVWFWMTRETGAAILFTGYMTVAGLMEHVLKPIVMGKGLETPMPVILVGVLGGTVAYGLPGLFLGPLVLAVAYELLVHWTRTRLDPLPAADRSGGGPDDRAGSGGRAGR